MTAFDEVIGSAYFPQQLNHDDAKLFERRILGEAPEAILEVCQDSSQITLLLAAALKDQGKGTLTTFQNVAGRNRKTFEKAVRQMDVQDSISVLPAGRSYTWAMQRLLASETPPTFDICVLNGNKTWDSVGFSAFLAHLLLRPGGLLVLRDVSWKMATSPYFKERPHLTDKYDVDELEAAPVQCVIDLLLPHLGYEAIAVPETRSFGLARKG